MPNPQSPLRILLTNDDGIHAPGLQSLLRIAEGLSDDIWIVAPEQEQSGAAHSLTLHYPVRVRNITKRHFAITGTPTDCVLLAARELLPLRSKPRGKQAASALSDASWERQEALPEANKRIDLVLSGVNRGSNVGDDITYSGTVAAAMEATLLGIPAIALSQLFVDGGTIHWKTAETHAPDIIRNVMKAGWPKGTLMNVNFPDCTPKAVKGISVAPQGKRVVSVGLHARTDPRGRPYFWLGGDRDNAVEGPHVDVAKLDAGYITITPIQMDMTDYKTLTTLEAVFETK